MPLPVIYSRAWFHGRAECYLRPLQSRRPKLAYCGTLYRIRVSVMTKGSCSLHLAYPCQQGFLMIALQRFRLGNPPHVLLRAASALTARLVSVMLSWARRARE